MDAKTLPRHARPLAVGRWAGRIAERRLVRPLAHAMGVAGNEAGLPDTEATRPALRRDPLVDPLAVTEHCFIGDQIRLPAACCDVVGCGAEFADLAALGEADNRARALAAGWHVDAFGRLVCPACQQRDSAMRPWTPGAEPDTGGGPTPATIPSAPGDGGGPPGDGGSPSARAGIAGSRSAVSPDRHRMTQWLHAPAALASRARWLQTLAALAGGNNGWKAPQAPQAVLGPHQEGTGLPRNPAGPQTGSDWPAAPHQRGREPGTEPEAHRA